LSSASEEEEKSSNGKNHEPEGNLDKHLNRKEVERFFFDVDTVHEIDRKAAAFDAGANDVGKAPKVRARKDVEASEIGDDETVAGGLEVADFFGERAIEGFLCGGAFVKVKAIGAPENGASADQ
jgi:hypothetical protein